MNNEAGSYQICTSAPMQKTWFHGLCGDTEDISRSPGPDRYLMPAVCGSGRAWSLPFDRIFVPRI